MPVIFSAQSSASLLIRCSCACCASEGAASPAATAAGTAFRNRRRASREFPPERFSIGPPELAGQYIVRNGCLRSRSAFSSSKMTTCTHMSFARRWRNPRRRSTSSAAARSPTPSLLCRPRASTPLLLDLNLPDSAGLDTIGRMLAAAPGVPSSC
jgi:hypothetical protein